MELYVGCLAQNQDDEPGRAGIGYVGILNGVTVEGSLGYYQATFHQASLLSLIVPLQERQHPTHVFIHCDMPLLMGLLQQDRINRTAMSFNVQPAKAGSGVKYPDLMAQYRLLSGFHALRFDWLKPHSTHWGMVRAYQLAERAMQSPTELS